MHTCNLSVEDGLHTQYQARADCSGSGTAIKGAMHEAPEHRLPVVLPSRCASCVSQKVVYASRNMVYHGCDSSYYHTERQLVNNTTLGKLNWFTRVRLTVVKTPMRL
jgi:hypothetical protein